MTVSEALPASARRGARRRAGRSATRSAACPPSRSPRRTPLPGFARATVDGYAVRAADTYGASEALPSYLDLDRRGRDGPAARGGGAARAPRWRSPTGAPLPPGADAVLKVEHTQPSRRPGYVEVLRAATPGEGMVRAGRGRRARRRARPAGPPAARRRPRHARRGRRHRARRARAPARGHRLDGRRARARDARPTLDARPGARRLRARARRPGARGRRRAGTSRHRARRRDAAASSARSSRGLTLEDRRGRTWSCVSAGSSVGARDVTAAAIASLGRAGRSVCHGLSLKPGKPTLLADCGGVPLIGLPGNPRSALVVFRLVGMPLVRHGGRDHRAAARAERRAPASRATCRAPPAGSTSSRCTAGRSAPDAAATPPLRLDRSRSASDRQRADGYFRVPEAATGLGAGSAVEVDAVPLVATRCPVPIQDHPGRRGARRVGGCAAAGCPERLEVVRLPLDRGARPGDGRAGLGAALVTAVRRRRDGRHRGPRRGHRRRERNRVRAGSTRLVRDRRHRRPDSRRTSTRSSCASTCTGWTAGPRCRPPPRRGSTCARSARTSSATELLLPAGPPAAPRRPGRRGRRRARRAGGPARAAS